ncbi:complement factor B [Apostichopus japonicus]|uniref:Complement factor B n=1 Tax=Stichopus japonicus TaxID=307972 RepID=A0A2G8JEJ9_STIJA|nr:complement factor B [Apostichopus japonicus]
MFEASALFEAVVSNETTNTNVDQTARFIPLSHDTGLDIYFMFDGSSSVGEDNFKKTKRFAKELVKEIGVSDRPNSLRVGALVFNSETEIGFHTVAFDSTDDVLDAIDSMQYRGEATEGGDAQADAREVELQGVTIHCIGISENATRRSLSALASEPLHEHLFFLKDYSTLERLIKVVTNQTIGEEFLSPLRKFVTPGVGGYKADFGLTLVIFSRREVRLVLHSIVAGSPSSILEHRRKEGDCCFWDREKLRRGPVNFAVQRTENRRHQGRGR